MVPILVLAGIPAAQAAPLGLLTVAAGSLAAAPRQTGGGFVDHRLAVAIEIPASGGALIGAALTANLPEEPLIVTLALAALAAALLGLFRNGLEPQLGSGGSRGQPAINETAQDRSSNGLRHSAQSMPLGMVLIGLSGIAAGTAGVSGGFIKTPVIADLMRVPTKVAAATTTFTVGITATAALVVFAFQGRIDMSIGSPAVLGSLIGGAAGARLQSQLREGSVRRVLSVILGAAAVALFLSI